MTPEQARERVARGVALLDEKRPGWERLIQLGSLNLSTCHECVLGQLGGTFGTFLGAMFPQTSHPERMDLAYRCGFYAHGEGYSTLQSEWVRAIEARISAAPIVTWTHREPAKV